jgi:vanillate/3-O-methylgallate O-demethylase
MTSSVVPRSKPKSPIRSEPSSPFAWNSEDVIDIYASLLRPGPEYKTLDLPYAPNVWPQAHADHVLREGYPVGISSGTTYSYYFREVLSMGCIDVDTSKIGTEVIVQWGDYGGRIKNVRTTVARFPVPDRRAEQRPRCQHDQVSDLRGHK